MNAVTQPDHTWRRRARTALFGVDFRGPATFLTPLAPIYRRLAADASEYEGWWPAAIVADVLIALVPQGSPMLDAVYSLDPGTEITFVGLTGTLRDHDAGTVLEPSAASIAGTCVGGDPAGRPLSRASSRTHPASPIGTLVHSVSVGCLAESTQRHASLALSADCVDLETGPLFAAAAACGHPVRSVLVVSDTNRDGAVFGNDLSRVQEALDAVCTTIRSTVVTMADAVAGRTDHRAWARECHD